MGRAASSEEVAAATVFLASPLSSYMSGQSLILDGGATAVGPFPTL
jgi:3-oxoacyl-[acyl-carrier protein] reductase